MDVDEVVILSRTVRRSIRGSKTRSGDIERFNRYLGKVEVLVESLCEWVDEEIKESLDDGGKVLQEEGWGMVARNRIGSACLEPPRADLEDIKEAIQSLDDAVSGIQKQSSFERLVLLEENQEILKVVATDLMYSLSTFEGLLPGLPEEVHDDYQLLKTQLENVSFSADCKVMEQVSGLLSCLVLHFCGSVADGEVLARMDVLVSKLMAEEGLIQGSSNLDEGDEWRSMRGWVVNELCSLCESWERKKEDGDAVSCFQYQLIAHALAAWGLQTGLFCLPPDQELDGWNRETLMCTEKRHMDTSGCVGSKDMDLLSMDDSSAGCLLINVEEALKDFIESHPFMPILRELRGDAWGVDASMAVRNGLIAIFDGTDSMSVLSSYILPIMVENEAGRNPRILCEVKVHEILLALLESRHVSAPWEYTLLALRTLLRDQSCRSQIRDRKRGLHILLGFLTSSVPSVRRSACKALGNYCMRDPNMKCLAHKMGATQSLCNQLARNDTLGQEAATATLANLIASSEVIQTEFGHCYDNFTLIVGMLEFHLKRPKTESTVVLQHAARVIQNLTSRVNVNRMKAINAGVLGVLEKLLCLPEMETRSYSALALCNVTRCRMDKLSAISPKTIVNLMDIFQDRAFSDSVRNSSLIAVKHILLANKPEERDYQMRQVELIDSHLDALVGLLRSGKDQMRCAAAEVIELLCVTRSPRIRQVFVDKGAVTVLKTMLDQKACASVAESTLALLVPQSDRNTDLKSKGKILSKLPCFDQDSLELNRSDSSPSPIPAF
eukprot:jgi/Picsp_1/5691/NSC_03050-R1_vacuolar armadillo repeat protein